MEKTELMEIMERLYDQYGSGNHYEVVFAEKLPDSGRWSIEVGKIEESDGKEGE